MEDDVGASHHLIEGPLLQQVCLVQGQLPGQRLAQGAQMGNLLLVLEAADRASDGPALLEQLRG